ncbi:MAG: thioesterase domain-containing protein [Candidatus Devosia euplotis]|nr:thioesterase domain-containing protein [Candidatus Devosia euplotis]
MTPIALEHYLHEHIPLSRAMAVRVVSIGDDSVVLAAPLTPNINHRETVFGGSASAVAILSAWCLLHLRLTLAGQPSRVVIQRNNMGYLAPIAGDFTARSALAPGQDWPKFMVMLTRKGIARIGVDAVLECDDVEAGRLSGEFVAFGGGRR